jgi:hypothetical protein
VLLANSLAIAAGYTILFWALARHTGVKAAAVATFVGAAVGAVGWNVRPQTASILAFGVLLALIESHRHGNTRVLWWAVPLFALWGNAHGGFVFGAAVLGFYLLSQGWQIGRKGLNPERRSQMLTLGALGLLVLASLAVNPQGPIGLVRYVLGFLQSDATIQMNQEFAPISVRSPQGFLFFASLALLTLAVVGAKIRPTSDQLLSIVVFALLTLATQRTILWYGFLLVPVVGHAFRPRQLPDRPQATGRLWANVTIVATLIAVTLFSVPLWRFQMPNVARRWPILDSRTPVVASQFLCDTMAAGTKGFQFQSFASYQVNACPALPLFIDTRFELYPPEQWKDYMALSNARYDWEQVAEKYGISYLFLSSEHQPSLVRAAVDSDNWQEIYRDELAVVLEKDTPSVSDHLGDIAVAQGHRFH